MSMKIPNDIELGLIPIATLISQSNKIIFRMVAIYMLRICCDTAYSSETKTLVLLVKAVSTGYDRNVLLIFSRIVCINSNTTSIST